MPLVIFSYKPVPDIENLSDSIGFFSDLSLVEIVENLSDSIGFISDLDYEFIELIVLTDLIGFNDVINDLLIYENALIDLIGFDDIVDCGDAVLKYLTDSIGFYSNRIYTRDHILRWRSRTYNYIMGYGGGPFGDFEYGGGEANDIDEFKVILYNQYGEILRDVFVSLLDKTESNNYFVYSWQDNLDDNTWYNHELTFDVYSKGSGGNYSEKRTVSRSGITPLAISNCVMWLNADSITGYSNGADITVFPDLSGYNNNLNRVNYSTRIYNSGGPRNHKYVWSGYNSYGWSSFKNDSLINIGSKISIFVIGRCTGESSSSYFLFRDFGSAPRFYLGYRSNKMDVFHFNGDVYNASNTIDGQFHLWSATIGGSGIDSYVYKDGIELAHNQNGVYSFDNRITLGGYPTYTYTCEIIVYNRVLNAMELDDIHGYLMHKYF